MFSKYVAISIFAIAATATADIVNPFATADAATADAASADPATADANPKGKNPNQYLDLFPLDFLLLY